MDRDRWDEAYLTSRNRSQIRQVLLYQKRVSLDLSELSLESQAQILRVFSDTLQNPLNPSHRGFPLSTPVSFNDLLAMWSNFNKAPNGPRSIASDLIIEALNLNRGIYGQSLENFRSSGIRLIDAMENYGFDSKVAEYPFDDEVSE